MSKRRPLKDMDTRSLHHHARQFVTELNRPDKFLPSKHAVAYAEGWLRLIRAELARRGEDRPAYEVRRPSWVRMP